MSVRFLGRRVYLSLAVVLTSARLAGQRPAAARVAAEMNIPVRTLQRWRQWWDQQFPLTPLWQADYAATGLPPAYLPTDGSSTAASPPHQEPA